MPVQITIRNVPDPIRDALAARAASEQRSMQEFLLRELKHLAERPSRAQWLDRVRSGKREAGVRIAPSDLLQHRDADRR